MFYVGIDIAKQTHYAAVVDSDGEVLCEPFSFNNNHQGFNMLLNILNSYPKDKTFIGMESTAHYAENLINFLYTRGFQVRQLYGLHHKNTEKAVLGFFRIRLLINFISFYK